MTGLGRKALVDGSSSAIAAGAAFLECDSFVETTGVKPREGFRTLSKIVVTGGSGKAGRACIKDLLAHGYDVLNVDSAPPTERLCAFIQVDLNDYGQTIDALSDTDFGPPKVAGIVHLAAIPAPRNLPNAKTFENNMMSTYNVFEAARRLGVKNVVWASSETVLGLPFDTPPPYVPVDEEYAGRPESAYSLTKLLGEEMAKQFCRWDPEMTIIGLQLFEHHGAARLRQLSEFRKQCAQPQVEPMGLHRRP